MLDIATGTGIWAIELGRYSLFFGMENLPTLTAANNFPSARVAGTDLSPVQPVLLVFTLSSP